MPRLLKALVLLFLLGGASAACSSGGPAPAAPSPTVMNPLVGEWLLTASSSPGTPSGINTRHKVFTNTTWEITQNDNAGAVVFHHGGHYEIVGAQYTEHVDFANANTAVLIGTTSVYQVQFGAGIYMQTGTLSGRGGGTPLAETWMRIDP